MRKKIGVLGVAIIMIVSTVLSGCSMSNEETKETVPVEETTLVQETDELEEIEQAVQMFLESYKSYDIDTLRTLCDDAAFESMGLKKEKTEELKRTLLVSLGMEGEVSEEAERAAEDFAKGMIEGEIRNVEVEDVIIEEGVGFATAYIYHGPTKESIDSMDFSETYRELASAYTNEHMDELVDLYNEEGEEAFKSTLKDRLFPILIDAVKERMDGIDSIKYKATITIEKKDGVWLITNFFENPESTEAVTEEETEKGTEVASDTEEETSVEETTESTESTESNRKPDVD